MYSMIISGSGAIVLAGLCKVTHEMIDIKNQELPINNHWRNGCMQRTVYFFKQITALWRELAAFSFL